MFQSGYLSGRPSHRRLSVTAAMSRQSSMYRPLRGSEIRLLKILPELRDGLIDCNIHYADLNLRPEYYALSYVWGDPDDTVPIYVNGSLTQVTRSLQRALARFRLPVDQEEDAGDDGIVCPSPHNKAWWIDALCIRQDDEEERSREVLRMGTIFGTATTVWVWLGLGEDSHESVATQKLFRFGQELDREFQRIIRDHTPDMSPESLSQAIEAKQHSMMGPLVCGQDGSCRVLLEAMKIILSHPWYTRIWTLQEAVLPKHFESLVFDTGTAVLDYAMLRCLFIFISRAEGGEYGPVHDAEVRSDLGTVRTLTIRDYDLFSFRSMRKERVDRTGPATSNPEDPDPCGKSLAKNLHDYLGVMARRNSTVPHDKIYGILGLVEKASSLPEPLKPDYSLDFRVVYGRFARFIMEQTGYLDILHYTDLRVKYSGVPSWFPNLLASPSLTVKPEPDEPVPYPLTRGSVKFSEDGNVLAVQGCIVDTIGPDYVQHSVSSQSVLPSSQAEVLEAWIEAFKRVFIPSAERVGQHQKRDAAVEIFTHCASGVDLHRSYGVLKKSARDELPELGRLIYGECLEEQYMGPRSPSYQNILEHPFWKGQYQSLQELLGERLMGNCVLTAKSQMIILTFCPIGNASLAKGDVICEIKGALMPMILRPMASTGHYTLVGSCDIFPWMMHYMDEEHFEGKELETFHIH
ncbi:Heterokaryon incompatibility protein (HET) domain containing protein [Naviculisporaceae sp. PSN 640]